MRWIAASLVVVCVGYSPAVRAASLPDHEPIDLVIIGDGVNPHDLPPESLTEPQDLAAALSAEDSGLTLDLFLDVDSQCVDDGIEALEDGVDVLVYFAHVAARSCADVDAQDRLTEAIEGHLQRGGGVVVFHHGIFASGGKQALLRLLGGVAQDLVWDPLQGQSVINVAGDHFVATHEIAYTDEVELEAPALGIEPALYPRFTNLPDERYPGLELLVEEGEERTILFASGYDGPQVLGYDLRRPSWAGHVVLYQPGEFQPLALDDRTGPNFQILANAILYAATRRDEPVDPGDGTSTGAGAETGSLSTTGGPSEPGTSDAGTTLGSATGGDDGSLPPGTTTGLPSEPSAGSETGASGLDAAATASCACRATPSPRGGPTGLALLATLALWRTLRARHRARPAS